MGNQQSEIKPLDLEVSPCPASEVRAFIEENHYSGSINGVKITQCFRVDYNSELVGAVLFGAMSTTAWKKFDTNEKAVLELRRLVLLDKVGYNSESRVISICLKHIKRFMPEVKLIVSYADPQYGHDGTIYKAANFDYWGTSSKDKGYLDTETNKVYHSRALRTKYKGDYKPFVKRLRKRLEEGVLVPIELPPKHCFVYEFSNRAQREVN